MLGKCFPPWTVTRSAWAVAQERGVSGIDVMLFSQHGTRLVHWYRVFTDNMQHQLLWGLFMTKLTALSIIHRTAEMQLLSPASAPLPLSIQVESDPSLLL